VALELGTDFPRVSITRPHGRCRVKGGRSQRLTLLGGVRVPGDLTHCPGMAAFKNANTLYLTLLAFRPLPNPNSLVRRAGSEERARLRRPLHTPHAFCVAF